MKKLRDYPLPAPRRKGEWSGRERVFWSRLIAALPLHSCLTVADPHGQHDNGTPGHKVGAWLFLALCPAGTLRPYI